MLPKLTSPLIAAPLQRCRLQASPLVHSCTKITSARFSLRIRSHSPSCVSAITSPDTPSCPPTTLCRFRSLCSPPAARRHKYCALVADTSAHLPRLPAAATGAAKKLRYAARRRPACTPRRAPKSNPQALSNDRAVRPCCTFVFPNVPLNLRIVLAPPSCPSMVERHVCLLLYPLSHIRPAVALVSKFYCTTPPFTRCAPLAHTRQQLPVALEKLCPLGVPMVFSPSSESSTVSIAVPLAQN